MSISSPTHGCVIPGRPLLIRHNGAWHDAIADEKATPAGPKKPKMDNALPAWFGVIRLSPFGLYGDRGGTCTATGSRYPPVPPGPRFLRPREAASRPNRYSAWEGHGPRVRSHWKAHRHRGHTGVFRRESRHGCGLQRPGARCTVPRVAHPPGRPGTLPYPRVDVRPASSFRPQ